MANPLVTVIIPAFNAEKCIIEALDSVVAQTYRPIEVIVVDDGSSDNTAKVVKDYCSVSTRTVELGLRCICQRNGGPSMARNTGIKEARGGYVAFLDADDLWMSHKLEKQMQLFGKDFDADVVFTDVKVTKQRNGRTEEFVFFQKYALNTEFFGHAAKVINPVEKLLRSNFMLTPSVVVRRGCLNDGFFFNEDRRYAEDWEAWLTLSLGSTFCYVNEVCVHVRDEEDGLCSNERAMLLSKMNALDDFLIKNMGSISSQLPPDKLSEHLKEIYKWTGYHFMKQGNIELAKKYYKKSFKEAFDPGTMVYYLKALIKSVKPQKNTLS